MSEKSFSNSKLISQSTTISLVVYSSMVRNLQVSQSTQDTKNSSEMSRESTPKTWSQSSPKKSKKSEEKSQSAKRNIKRDSTDTTTLSALKRSKALRYSKIPTSENDLDIYESEVFDMLKDWRAKRATENENEWIHHIASNRTLAELIRRQRNKVDWASGDKTKIFNELQDCFGMSTKKSAEGHSGYDMMQFVNSDKKVHALLEQSRAESNKHHHK